MGDDHQQVDSGNSSDVAASLKDYRFFGSYAYSIDNKGRIVVPNSYRISLGEMFTVGPTQDFQGIALYPDAVYDRILADILSMNQRKPIVQKFATQLSKLSYREMQTDAQGRLLLPAKLRQRMLGEDKELEISGALDHVRIVDIAKADADDSAFTTHLEDILEQLGNLEP